MADAINKSKSQVKSSKAASLKLSLQPIREEEDTKGP